MLNLVFILTLDCFWNKFLRNIALPMWLTGTFGWTFMRWGHGDYSVLVSLPETFWIDGSFMLWKQFWMSCLPLGSELWVKFHFCFEFFMCVVMHMFACVCQGTHTLWFTCGDQRTLSYVNSHIAPCMRKGLLVFHCYVHQINLAHQGLKISLYLFSMLP